MSGMFVAGRFGIEGSSLKLLMETVAERPGLKPGGSLGTRFKRPIKRGGAGGQNLGRLPNGSRADQGCSGTHLLGAICPGLKTEAAFGEVKIFLWVLWYLKA